MIRGDKKVESVSLYDYMGRQVMYRVYNSFNPVVNVTGLAKGLYIARITTSSGQSTSRVIVE